MKFIILGLLVSGVAQPATLPNPAYIVDLRANRTDITVNSVEYQAPSQFVYVTECAIPDSYRYNCNINREDGVALYNVNGDGSHITVTIIAKFESTLIGGHNLWSPKQTVLDGTVTP